MLIQRVRAGGDSDDAAERLINEGPVALREVIAAASRSKTDEPDLRRIIERSTGVQAVSVLIEGASSSQAAVKQSIALALMNSGVRQGRDFVLGRLVDSAELPSSRSAIARALYGQSGSAVRRALRIVLAGSSESEEQDPFLLIEAATALATVGDHRGVEVIAPLLSGPDEFVRAQATSALRILTGPDMFDWLSRAADDPSVEVRSAAIDPLFLLGAPACVEVLLGLATDDDESIRRRSQIRIAGVLGLVLDGDEDDLEFIHEEWKSERLRMAPKVCHRFADPINLNDLVQDFTDRPNERLSLSEEIRIITGVDILPVYQLSGEEAVPQALAQMKFAIGAVNKWGHRRPMPHMPTQARRNR